MSLKSYFTLFRKQETSLQVTDAAAKLPNPLPQWVALYLGVLLQPFFTAFREGKGLLDINNVYGNFIYIIFGIIVATILFPSVYRSSFDTDRPKFLQIIPIFTAGLGWQTMIDVIQGGT